MRSTAVHPARPGEWTSFLRAQRWLAWIGAAALGGPTAVVLHELGHYIAARSFGFPDVVLRYASVDSGAAEAGFPMWQQGVQAAAGPFTTLAIVLACCYGVARIGPRPWLVAPAFAAGVRSVMIGAAFLAVRLRHPGAEGNFDELNAAQAFGLPAELVIGSNVLLLLGAWAFMIRRVPQEHRALVLTWTAVGTVAGLVLYLGWVGPRLLP